MTLVHEVFLVSES